jgi:hypothetical protein
MVNKVGQALLSSGNYQYRREMATWNFPGRAVSTTVPFSKLCLDGGGKKEREKREERSLSSPQP